MRGLKTMASSIILGAALWSAASAAPAAGPSGPASRPSSVEADCQKVGGNVSALIDKGTASPNIAAARAAFQVGIMDCMDGDDVAAIKHYQDVRKLLNSEQQNAPVSSPAPKQPG